MSVRTIVRFCHSQSVIKTTYPFVSFNKRSGQIKTNINLPLKAPIPRLSMMKDKAKEDAMIPFVEASSKTPGNSRRHKVKYNAQRHSHK